LEESLDEALFLAPLKDTRKRQIKALLLSGGGNDLINWKKGNAKFSPIFRKGQSIVALHLIPSSGSESATSRRRLIFGPTTISATTISGNILDVMTLS